MSFRILFPQLQDYRKGALSFVSALGCPVQGIAIETVLLLFSRHVFDATPRVFCRGVKFALSQQGRSCIAADPVPAAHRRGLRADYPLPQDADDLRLGVVRSLLPQRTA